MTKPDDNNETVKYTWSRTTPSVHHIVITVDDTTANVYINNVNVIASQTVDNMSSIELNGNWLIGKQSDTDAFLTGNMKYFRFWNGVVLSSSEVSTLYNSREENIIFKDSL